jgi:hypothetical protein
MDTMGFTKYYKTKEEVILAWVENCLSISDAIKLLKEEFDEEYVQTVSGSLLPRANAFKCEGTGLYYDNSLSHNHYVVGYINNPDSRRRLFQRRDIEEIFVHNSYGEEHGFWCERTEKWYNKAVFEQITIDGIQLCQEACMGDLYWWESDLSYHLYPEETYDDDCDFSPEDANDIPDYHSHARPYEEWKKVSGYGVELEIFSPERQKLWKSLPKDIFGERDGSLDENGGIELIGAPYEFSQYVNHATSWKNVIDEAVNLGSKSGKEGQRNRYGMHISASRSLFPNDYLAAKFIVFFNMQDEFCKMIAQRDIIYQGNYKIRNNLKKCVGYMDEAGYLYDYRGDRSWKKTIYTSKYEAVQAAKNRLEVRIFRSTLDYSSFLKNIEFVEAVRRWTAERSTKTNAISRVRCSIRNKSGTVQFLNWLANQEGFLNLKKYIIRKAESYPDIKGLDLIKI